MAGDRSNIISPAGFAALRAEYDALLGGERPKLVETISWAAGNGDRSENGDYIYGRKRLREIDRRLAFLARRMKAARVVDPAAQPDRDRIWFGASVELADEDDMRRTVTLTGDDEADAGAGRIGWNSPLARALRGAAVGDLRTVQLPAGPKEWEVMAIAYPGAGSTTPLPESGIN
ncbi:GreA/GreB family elongation factor [Sphingopyxis granuli]|uniref:Transcription elongation factor GreB n=1 Tax=Sphingopyxis granuli TaxID=267128 RepID=A0AA86GN83_9SPHN|nr:GreA/GreB family elongation factor [Sphingopyxis granuli]AMG75296.1 Transcript cleavage factor GreB [Sphingopyxis granuli]